MKKLLYSVSTALLLLSCNTEDPSLEAEPGKGGNVITFVGRTFPETRTEIGVKDGNSYPVLWSSGDRIGIISPVETLFQNASATLNASDAGTNHSAPRTSASRTAKIVSPDFIACARSAAALASGFFAGSSRTARTAEAATPRNPYK